MHAKEERNHVFEQFTNNNLWKKQSIFKHYNFLKAKEMLM